MEFSVRISKKRIVTIVAAIVVIVAALFVFYDLNGHSLDPTDRDYRVVVTGSMDGDPQPYEIPTIPVNSLIAIKHLSGGEFKTVKVGDVLAFNWAESGMSESRLTVHRVTEIHTDSEGNVTGFTTVGDIYNDEYPDWRHYETPDVENVVGVVIGVSPAIGKAVHFIQTSPIYVVMIIAVIAVIVSVVRDLLRARWTEDGNR